MDNFGAADDYDESSTGAPQLPDVSAMFGGFASMANTISGTDTSDFFTSTFKDLTATVSQLNVNKSGNDDEFLLHSTLS